MAPNEKVTVTIGRQTFLYFVAAASVFEFSTFDMRVDALKSSTGQVISGVIRIVHYANTPPNVANAPVTQITISGMLKNLNR